MVSRTAHWLPDPMVRFVVRPACSQIHCAILDNVVAWQRLFGALPGRHSHAVAAETPAAACIGVFRCWCCVQTVPGVGYTLAMPEPAVVWVTPLMFADWVAQGLLLLMLGVCSLGFNFLVQLRKAVDLNALAEPPPEVAAHRITLGFAQKAPCIMWARKISYSCLSNLV